MRWNVVVTAALTDPQRDVAVVEQIARGPDRGLATTDGAETNFVVAE